MSKKQLGFDFGKSKGSGCADTNGRGPTPKPGEQVYCAQFMSKAALRREFIATGHTYRHAVASAKTKEGPRAVRGWFATKPDAMQFAERLKKTEHQVGRVKARPVGERAPTKTSATRPGPAKSVAKAKTPTPAIKIKAKKEAAKLPTPVSVAELVNQRGQTIEVAELNKNAQVLLTLKTGEMVKVTANGFPRGPVLVEAAIRSKSMLNLSLTTMKGGKKGRSYMATYHYPERTPDGRLKQYRPFVLLARSRASITKIVRYDAALDDAKKYKGPRPGAKDWAMAGDRARMEYFRDTLYKLAQEKSDDRAEEIRMALILAVERSLEKSYVCQALKEYGRVPKVRRIKVGDIFEASWGYDQTNIDFYQVVSLTEKSAKIRKLAKDVASRTRGSEHVVARKGDFIAPEKTKRILYEWPSSRAKEQRITPAIKINTRTFGWLWDGKPARQTASGYGH